MAGVLEVLVVGAKLKQVASWWRRDPYSTGTYVLVEFGWQAARTKVCSGLDKKEPEWNDKLAFTAFTVDLAQYPELVVRLREHNMVTGDVEWGQAKLALPNKVEDTRLSSLVPLVNRKGKEIGQVQLLVTLKARDAAEEAAEQKGQLNGAPSTPRGDGDLPEEAGAGSPPAVLSTPTPVEGAALYNPLWQD